MTRACLLLAAPLVIALCLLEITMGEVPTKRFLTPDGRRPRRATMFTSGVMVGKTLYISGKGDYSPDAEFPDKVTNCLAGIQKTLQQAGLDMENVVKSFVYLEDHDHFAEFNERYAQFFPNDLPARTTLGVSLVPGESHVEITCIAYSDLSEKKRIGDPPAGYPFSPGILAGDTLYVSGKGDHLPGGGHPETFEEQVRQAMRNVKATLEQAGLDFRHVVLSHVFLDNYDNREVAGKVYSEFFEQGSAPACAPVFVDWLPGDSHVEITCIATTDLPNRKPVRVEGISLGPSASTFLASPAVWAGNTLYLSALGGVKAGDAATELGPQVRQMAQNDEQVLDAAGLKLEDIVSGCVYLRNMDDYRPMNEIYREYYSRGPGVRTCLMPNTSVEPNQVLVRASFIAARTKPVDGE